MLSLKPSSILLEGGFDVNICWYITLACFMLVIAFLRLGRSAIPEGRCMHKKGLHKKTCMMPSCRSFLSRNSCLTCPSVAVSHPGVFPVTVYGDFLPRHIFYRFHAVCAYLRCIFVALCVLLMWPSFDVVLADQVSIVIPVLKLRKSTKVMVHAQLGVMRSGLACLVSNIYAGYFLLPFSRLATG